MIELKLVSDILAVVALVLGVYFGCGQGQTGLGSLLVLVAIALRLGTIYAIGR